MPILQFHQDTQRPCQESISLLRNFGIETQARLDLQEKIRRSWEEFQERQQNLR